MWVRENLYSVFWHILPSEGFTLLTLCRVNISDPTLITRIVIQKTLSMVPSNSESLLKVGSKFW